MSIGSLKEEAKRAPPEQRKLLRPKRNAAVVSSILLAESNSRKVARVIKRPAKNSKSKSKSKEKETKTAKSP